MRVLAVPVKALERAKTRLAPLLSPLERAALTLAMLEDVLDAALPQEGWDVWVFSPDEAVLEIAARRGARPYHEAAGSLLGAVRLVGAELPRRADELAVLLADLPWLTAAALGSALSIQAAVVAAPAASDGGTNLLVRRPPDVISARFGRESFGKHRWAARRARASFEQAGGPELANDLDRPQDVVTLLAAGAGSRTLTACHELDLAARLRLLRMA
jgi:2-phospho-L-lactate guanylyltransferase